MATAPKRPYHFIKDTYAASNGDLVHDVVRVSDGARLGRIKRVRPGDWAVYTPGATSAEKDVVLTQHVAATYLLERLEAREAATVRVGFEIGERTVDAPYARPGSSGRWSTRRRIGRLMIETDVLPDRILVYSRVVGTPTEADKALMGKSFGGDYLPVRSFPRDPQTAAQEDWTTSGPWLVRVDTSAAQV